MILEMTGTIAVKSKARQGLSLNVLKIKPMTYRAAHRRITRVRGKAMDQPCTDCGLPADQWSYVGSSEFEQSGTTPVINRKYGKTYQAHVSWSPSVWDYTPRCRPCHFKHDKAARA